MGVSDVQDLDALGSLPKLTHLSLLDNEVTKQPSYRRASVCPRAVLLVPRAKRSSTAAPVLGASL